MFLSYFGDCISFISLGISLSTLYIVRKWKNILSGESIRSLPFVKEGQILGTLQNPAALKELGGVQCVKCHLVVNRFQRLLNGSYVCVNCLRGNI